MRCSIGTVIRLLARAGYELPLFYDSQADGSVVIGPVDSPGMSVGMVEGAIFDSIIEDRIQFGENDALMLYTDGLTEMANRNGDEFSTARLQKCWKPAGLECGVLLQSTRKRQPLLRHSRSFG